MKSHSQLAHALKMPPQRTAPNRFPPRIFERLVGVEKFSGVKQCETAPE